jgi:hypothetical protein
MSELNNEEALRALVRQAVARHLHGADGQAAPPRPIVLTAHASHSRYVLPESDGPCLIEPSVQCTHCGYCQSHGH